jgi:predicted metalloprotease with PDZ domain
MQRLAPILVLAFALVAVGATVAFAGGAECDHSAKAAKTAEHHHSKAAEMAKHGWLGVETEKADAGYAITVVHADSPAEAAGFRVGDVLVAMNGIAFTESNKKALKQAKSELWPGSEVEYTVRRGSADARLTATLAPVPEEILARWESQERAAQGTRVADSN